MASTDPQSQAHEVAEILGWKASEPNAIGGVYIKSPHAAAMYYTQEEVSDLHRVMTSGKKAKEALASVLAAIRSNGQDRISRSKRSDWNPDAHVEVTMTAKDVFDIIDALFNREEPPRD